MATTTQAAIEAIKNHRGNISQAAKQLGLSRTQLYRIINDKPTVQSALLEERESFKDFAESKINEKIEAGDTTMIIFFAKTQMKDRGYVERQEITGADSGPVKISVIDDQLTKVYGNQSD